MLCKALFLSNCTSHFAHPSIKRMYKQTNAEEFQQDTTRANVVLTCLIRIDNNSGSLFQGQDFGSKNTRWFNRRCFEKAPRLQHMRTIRVQMSYRCILLSRYAPDSPLQEKSDPRLPLTVFTVTADIAASIFSIGRWRQSCQEKLISQSAVLRNLAFRRLRPLFMVLTYER